MQQDIRWQQRFSNYSKALASLLKFVQQKDLNELEKQGLIQAFEYTHELAWKTLKDFIEFQGNNEIYGSRDTTREAFKLNLISNGDLWMDMIKNRNQTSHTYNNETAEQIVVAIKNNYVTEFELLHKKMTTLLK